MQFPKQAPHTVWVTACFISVFSVCLCSFFPSLAMGDIHLAALFSWGDIRTVSFEFYRNSASLSHCTFICSSDNLKDQQRCPSSQWEPPLIWKGKKQSFFSFFLFLLTGILWIWWTTRIITGDIEPGREKAIPHGDRYTSLESQLQSVCQSHVRERFFSGLLRSRVRPEWNWEHASWRSQLM